MLWLRVMVLSGLIAGGACGGGGDENADVPATVAPYEAEGPSLEGWREQTTAVCERYEPQQDAVVAAHPPSGDPARVVAFVDS